MIKMNDLDKSDSCAVGVAQKGNRRREPAAGGFSSFGPAENSPVVKLHDSRRSVKEGLVGPSSKRGLVKSDGQAAEKFVNKTLKSSSV